MLLLFLSSFLAATFIPFSSEVHFAAVLSNSNFWTAIFVATAGNTLGGIFTYYLGWLAKWNWIEKALRTPRIKVERFKNKIQKYGGWMGLLCWTPVFGDVLAIGLGVFRVSPLFTFITMLLGKALRYILIGYFLS